MLADLMFQRANWYRPTPGTDAVNSDYLGQDAVVQSNVPCSIQPMKASEVQFYLAFRSMEVSHSIYTTTTSGWARNDVLVYSGRRFQVVGVRDLIELGRVVVLDALEYRGANERQ